MTSYDDSPRTAGTEELEALLQNARSTLSLSEDIARKFMLASALEPIADKPGCTTRFVDVKESKKLEYFVAAGINSGFAIKHIAEYIAMHKTIAGAYALLPEAIVASKLNRFGGKINQGILELIVPIIAVELMYPDIAQHGAIEWLQKASFILKATTSSDVRNLIIAKELGNKISNVELKYPVRKHRACCVFDYYAQETEVEVQVGNTTGVLHNRQFVDGFSDIAAMMQIMNDSPVERLTEKVEEAYRFIRQKNGTEKGVGLMADQCALCIYLYISFAQDLEVIG
jgi:hypothetical protein